MQEPQVIYLYIEAGAPFMPDELPDDVGSCMLLVKRIHKRTRTLS